MVNEIRELCAGDVAVRLRGTVSGPFGSSISARFFVEDGVPVIRGNNLSLGTGGPRFVDEDFVYLTEEKADELSSSECVAGDIIFTARGTIGQTGIIPFNCKHPRYILSANQLRLRVNPEIADPMYMYYWFSSPMMVAIMKSRNAGSALPNMNLGTMRGLPVRLPSLTEQRRIAGILGAFDDKIELNRRMNATLEAMARALFQSWFVDFDPVRAKMDGRWRQGESLPGLPADWWHLFPDRLVDSELGPIPAGWRVGTLGDIFVNHNSKRIPISGDLREARKGNYPYYGATGILDFIDDFIFNGIFLLVGEDGSVQDSRGNGVTQYVWGKFWVNNHAHVLQGSDYISTEFLYLLMKNLVVTPFVTGAVQPKLSLGRLQMIPCIIPTPKIAQVFGGITENHFHLLRHYYDQTLLLEEFRDSLLPVLISHKE